MAKRKNDGVRRVMVAVYINQNIPLSAAQSGLTNAEFIEAMYKRSLMSEIPDDLPLADKQAKYVELDRTLRALGAVITEEKEKLDKLAKDKETFAETDDELTKKAILAVTDRILQPEHERAKPPLDLAVLRAEMLASATKGRVKLEPVELMELAKLRLDSRRKELDAAKKDQDARLTLTQ